MTAPETTDHETSESVQAAAEWLASPRPRSGRPTIPECRDRFDLTLPQAVEACRIAQLIRNKLLAFREERDISMAASRAAGDELRELQTNRALTETEWRQITDPDLAARYGKTRVDRDHPAALALQKRLDEITVDLKRVQEKYDARVARSQKAGRIINVLEEWARANSRKTIAMVELPKLAKADTPQAIAAKLDELHAELKAIDEAPVHSSVAKAHIARIVDEMGTAATPDVSRLLDGGNRIDWPTRRDELHAPTFIPAIDGKAGSMLGKAHSQTVDAVGLMCALARDEMVGWLEGVVDAQANDEAALDDETREAREREILAAILDLERKEAALAERGDIELRPDLDPRATLSVTVEG